MKKYVYLIAMVALLPITSCTSEQGDQPDINPDINKEEINGENNENTEFGEEEQIEVRGPLKLSAREHATDKAASDFALDYFRFNINDDSNCLVSPLSLQQCLALIANGTAGECREELIASIFNGTDVTIEDCNNYWQMQAQGLPAVTDRAKISLTNSIWTNKSILLKETFVSDVKNILSGDHYIFEGGSLKDQINSYVYKKTRGMIKDFLESELSFLNGPVLLNTLYFNSKWDCNFSKTYPNQTFHNLGGTNASVKMMEAYGFYAQYAVDEMAQYISIPLATNRFDMLMILPDNDKSLNQIVADINSDKLEDINTKMTSTNVIFRMPQFTVESNDDNIANFLKGKGMGKVFTEGQADFSNMLLNNGNYHIDQILQKSKVTVDEEGFTGAAATLATMTGSDISDEETVEPILVTADRPFIFIVRESYSGMILFIGRITKF